MCLAELLVQLDVRRLEGEHAAVGHGVARVDGEVQQHLDELVLVDLHLAQVGAERSPQLDVGTEGPARAAVSVSETIVLSDSTAGLQGLAAREGEYALGQAARPLGRRLDLADVLGYGARGAFRGRPG